MLIRITQNSRGIEEYLETGKKAGREHLRENLDKREYLSGDLNSLGLSIKNTRKNKPDWKSYYWHLTASFAVENNELKTETLTAINREIMEYYFCDYDVDKIIHAAEAHRPKIQSDLDKSTGEINQRLLHFHNAISKYDIETGNQIRMIPFNLKADRAFQSHLCQKYGLVDPADKKRKKSISKREIIARWKGDKDVAKQTKVSELRKLFSALVNDVDSLDEAKKILLESGIVESVNLKDIKSSGNKYLQVKTNLATRNINLRGKGFEALEKFYYPEKQAKTSDKNIDNKAIFTAHQKWWLEEQAKRNKKEEPKINYEKYESKYISPYEKYSKEQRVYFVIYKNNIAAESINGYKFFEKNNERHLFNNDLGVKIIDREDKVALSTPADPIKREKAVRLVLSIAQSKDWELENMTINGSFEFKQEVKKQIAAIKASKTLEVSQSTNETPGKKESHSETRSPIKNKVPGTKSAEQKIIHGIVNDADNPLKIENELERDNTYISKTEMNKSVSKNVKTNTNHTKFQRTFHMLYNRAIIDADDIEDFKFFAKEKTFYAKEKQRHVFNKKLGVKISDVETSNQISVNISRNPEKAAKGVKVAIAVALSKGWDLEEMAVTGSRAFKVEFKRQVAEMLESKPEAKPKLNIINQSINDVKEKQAKQLNKKQIVSLKLGLNASTVIDYACSKYGLLEDHFSVTSDNKINDDRTKEKPKNVIDFLIKTCNLKISNVLPELQELYEEQLNQAKKTQQQAADNQAIMDRNYAELDKKLDEQIRALEDEKRGVSRDTPPSRKM